MSIGQVAARNIAMYLNLAEEHIPAIESAIKDEIGAMSSHFTLAIADVQTQFEVEVAKIKSTYSYLSAHSREVLGALLAVFSGGALIGAVLGHFA